jgi:hypothetical protein
VPCAYNWLPSRMPSLMPSVCLARTSGRTMPSPPSDAADRQNSALALGIPTFSAFTVLKRPHLVRLPVPKVSSFLSILQQLFDLRFKFLLDATLEILIMDDFLHSLGDDGEEVASNVVDLLDSSDYSKLFANSHLSVCGLYRSLTLATKP